MAAKHPLRFGSTWLLGCTLALSIPLTVSAQNASQEGSNTPAAAQQAPNPAAEKSLQQHFQGLLKALNTQAPIPDSKNFTDEFNQQVKTEQLKQVLEQVHQTVGNCNLVGGLLGPNSMSGSFLLQCDKGFVPIDMAVESKSPYRMHGVLIRPPYAKL